jgi:transposase
MTNTAPILPNDVDALQAMVASKDAEIHVRDLMIEKLKHQLAGHQRHRFGTSSETLDQLALDIEDREIGEAVTPVKADDATVSTKAKPKRAPLPPELPRETQTLPAGEACSTCGGRLKHLGEDVTEELEYVPGRFKVRRIVRPRCACADCEAMHQAPLPSRPIERGLPGPGLLAHVLVGKYADHLPLYRQSQIYARDGVELSRSTLTGWVGQCCALLEPLADAIGAHVRDGAALFADDTPVKLQAKGRGKTATARMWVYARDERPWSGDAAPAAWYRFTPDRRGEHPVSHLIGYRGHVHADGYAGFNGLFVPGKATEVACLAHVRRKFVDVHRSTGATIAEEAIRRIADLYAVESEARGQPPDLRAARRRERSAPVLDNLEHWLAAQLRGISGKTPLAAAIRYALSRLPKVRPYLDDGHLEIDNNPAERAMRPIALGRKNYLFMGSPAGGKAAASAYTLIETAKMNAVDPQAWLTHVIDTIADHPISQIDDIMPWNFKPAS